MDQERVIRAVKDNPQRLGHVARLHFDLALVGKDRHLIMLDAILFHECGVLRRDWPINESPVQVSR